MHHATNRKYVDDQDDAVRQYVDTQIGGLPTPTGTDSQPLNNVLGYGNDADDKKITGLKNPDDPQDAATKDYVDSEAKIIGISFDSDKDELSISEGGSTYKTTLNITAPTTVPANLAPGKLFVGNSSSQPAEVTLTGDISIDADGKVTITNITTAKIANAAVTKEKINADVAGPGLAKNSVTDPLEVKLGNGLAFDGDGNIRIYNPDLGYLGIGQGTGSNIEFRPVIGDATLAQDGKLIVQGLRGRTVASSAPSDKQVLQWDNDAKEWAPASLPPGGGGLPALPSGRLFIGNNGNQPTPTTISGDITIAANGTATIEADAVDQTKINPDVAGAGLSQAGDGSLRVNLGGDVTTGGGGSDLTVTKLQGNQVATTAPNVGDVLRWNGTAWEPDADSGGGSIGSTTDGERQNGLLNITQPTGSNRQIGTLWLDPSDGGSIKRWNGNGWVTLIDD